MTKLRGIELRIARTERHINSINELLNKCYTDKPLTDFGFPPTSIREEVIRINKKCLKMHEESLKKLLKEYEIIFRDEIILGNGIKNYESKINDCRV